MACGDVLSLEDLQTAKKHQIFEAEVITGKVGGVAGGATIGTATNPVTGQTQQTLPEVIVNANSAFDAHILNMGFARVGTFKVGATLTNPRQTLLWDIADGGDGHEYGWSGVFPKAVPPNSTPSSTGGVGPGAWVDRLDVTLRSDLASAGGAGLVGYSKGGTVASNLDLVVPENFDDTMYMSTYLFMFEDQTLPVYIRSIFDDREDYTNRSLHFGVRDDNGGLYSVESDYAVMLDASKIPFPVTGEHYYFTSRLKHYETDRRQRRQVQFRKVAPTAVTPNNLKYMVIGDSNTNIAFADLLRNTLRARGHNPNFVGTITGQGLDLSETSGPLGEGRSGWSSADFTYRVTSRTPVAIGSEAAYNGYSKAQKLTKNPFLIAGTGAGSFNGYKFDFASYLSRFNIATPDVVGIGLGPNNLALGGTDYEQIAIDFIADLTIMVDSIWAANPNTKIALYLRGMAKTEQQDALIEGHRWLQNKLLQYTRSHPRHGEAIWLISSWAHMSQEAGHTISTVENLSGVIKGNITDGVHPRIYEDTRGAYVASVAPWMAWVAYASNTSGYNGDPVHRQHTGGMGMLLGTAPTVFTVPAEQQSGTSLAQSIRSVSRANNSNTGPYNIVGKARGAESNPATVVDGDSLGKFGSAGYVTDRFMFGAELEFYVDGTPVTSQYVPSAARILIVRDTDKLRQSAIRFRSNGNIEAGVDNTQSLGTSTQRWSTVFAGTGTINTSDAREKTAPLPIDDAVLDAWGDVSLVTFKWLNAIQEKGEKNARWHYGVIAQQVRDAFNAHNLDGTAYGLLCYDEWDDVWVEVQTNEGEQVLRTRTVIRPVMESDPVSGEFVVKVAPVELFNQDGTPKFNDDGTRATQLDEVLEEVEEEYLDDADPEYETVLELAAGNRWGIRADQCLFLEAAYQRRRCDRIEARLASAGL